MWFLCFEIAVIFIAIGSATCLITKYKQLVVGFFFRKEKLLFLLKLRHPFAFFEMEQFT